MSDIVAGNIGSELAYDVAFVGGALVAKLGDAKYGAVVQVSINAKAVLEAARALLPPSGTAQEIGSLLINMAESATPAV